jgi:hypothetical protein
MESLQTTLNQLINERWVVFRRYERSTRVQMYRLLRRRVQWFKFYIKPEALHIFVEFFNSTNQLYTNIAN